MGFHAGFRVIQSALSELIDKIKRNVHGKMSRTDELGKSQPALQHAKHVNVPSIKEAFILIVRGTFSFSSLFWVELLSEVMNFRQKSFT